MRARLLKTTKKREKNEGKLIKKRNREMSLRHLHEYFKIGFGPQE